MKFFPMFLRMEGGEVVILGGGEQAAQKARLMLKTEARLTFIAPDLDPELAALVSEGRAVHETAPPDEARLAGAALVFICTGDPARDEALAEVARAAGCVFNVVDRPELCRATTPSLVDRDPLVVAIGTEGAAPVLARQIKTRLEEMLEPRLGDLVALAGRLRGAVAEGVPEAGRRAYWRWAFLGAPRRLHARGAEREAAERLKAAIAAGGAPDAPSAGTLALVVLPQGGRDLLTLRAVQRMQEADVIFHGELPDADVLEYARRDARREHLAEGEMDPVRGAVAAGEQAVWLLTEAPDAALRAALPEAELVPGVGQK